MFKLLFIFFTVWNGVMPKPLFSSVPKVLADFASASVSSASSFLTGGLVGNIEDLRVGGRPYPKAEVEDDPFFDDTDNGQQSVETTTETVDSGTTDDFLSGIVQQKISSILRKIQFFMTLSNPQSGDDNSDDVEDEFTREQNDFDKEFNAMNQTFDLLSDDQFNQVGTSKGDKVTLQSNGIGVFFMELLGSLIGLAYGAASQLNKNAGAH